MNGKAWYRQPMLALVIGLPAAVVVAGIATLVIAASGASDVGDDRVRRVAQTQTADLAPDRVAARLGISAVATIDANEAVRLYFEDAAPEDLALRLALRHATDGGRDRAVRLVRAGEGLFVGRLEVPRAAGAYNLELSSEAAGWRLVGRLDAGDPRARLAAALED